MLSAPGLRDMLSIEKANFRYGLTCAICAQILWGLFPIYVYQLKSYSAGTDFVAHRTLWSFVTLIGILGAASFLRNSKKTIPALPDPSEVASHLRIPQSIWMSVLAASLIVVNWLAFVWAVTNGHALDASLGYYLCPLVVILLGVTFLKERLSPVRWLAVLFAAGGVSFMASSVHGIPWIAIAIAVSFGFYGLVKKRTKISALGGLTFETGILLLPALAYLAWRFSTLEANPFNVPVWVYLMVLGTGVATIAPLALYANAVKHVPLSTVGFLQCIGPTIQFIVGLLFIGESLDVTRLIGFGIVWIGVGLFVFAMKTGR